MRSSGGWYLDQPEAPHAHRRRGAGPLVGGVELFGLTLRREHPLPFGRGVGGLFHFSVVRHHRLVMRVAVFGHVAGECGQASFQNHHIRCLGP
jgi:hypothetical protein